MCGMSRGSRQPWGRPLSHQEDTRHKNQAVLGSLSVPICRLVSSAVPHGVDSTQLALSECLTRQSHGDDEVSVV